MLVSLIIIYDDVSNSDNDCINNMTVIVNDQIKKEMMLSWQYLKGPSFVTSASLFSLSLGISPGTPKSGTPFHKLPILYPYLKGFWNGNGMGFLWMARGPTWRIISVRVVSNSHLSIRATTLLRGLINHA